jgi:hypothetical protein
MFNRGTRFPDPFDLVDILDTTDTDLLSALDVPLLELCDEPELFLGFDLSSDPGTPVSKKRSLAPGATPEKDAPPKTARRSQSPKKSVVPRASKKKMLVDGPLDAESGPLFLSKPASTQRTISEFFRLRRVDNAGHKKRHIVPNQQTVVHTPLEYDLLCTESSDWMDNAEKTWNVMPTSRMTIRLSTPIQSQSPPDILDLKTLTLQEALGFRQRTPLRAGCV